MSIGLPRLDEEEPAVGKGFEVELGKFWLNEETGNRDNLSLRSHTYTKTFCP
ncbi:MAG: hypothetical protein PUP91_23565 [Rhizonema sp. PD37]|nr:hypothetical protein [Rhizonema sp. PD37]